MERLGYTKIATKISLTKLVKKEMLSTKAIPNQNDDGFYSVYNMQYTGTEYILANVDKVGLHKKSRAAPDDTSIDDDIPF